MCFQFFPDQSGVRLFSFVATNIGERDEPIITEKLISLKGKSAGPLGIINSVADYRELEYPDGTKRSQIMKAPTGAKRDVSINGKGYSLKSTARPAIVNHTSREKWIRVCNTVGVEITMLDEMVSEYWRLRTDRKIGEDVATSNHHCPFGNTAERLSYLKALINYFLFDGTGSKDSSYPADYILEFDHPLAVTTWKILDRDSAFKSMWPRMIFSVRSKRGMPTNYSKMRDVKKKALMAPWVRFIDGDYRGALHIRVKK